MSYNVLARKWRPKIFSELVGQQHVVRALQNSITNQKLHHAYLFTGTRGVGKTTIARVFAKSLNCENGHTSTPCLSCAACRAIDEGRYADLIEVDAASRTRVEDTKELLDNVQYLPSQGRYKIYLIDEIHMLSGHSFNALLKTLEEPPEHVIFLLATTDPQKIPVTVLSRCLQFTLKPLSVSEIAQYLETVLKGEQLSFDSKALALLAKSARGSLRDSLSLLDQAIAYTGGNIVYSMVLDMLGTVDDDLIYSAFEAISNNNGQELLSICRVMADEGVDFSQVLERFIDILHQMAVCQNFSSEGMPEKLAKCADMFSKEDVQLFYEICLKGLNDIGMVPLASIGFEMTLLRMLSFKLSKPAISQVKEPNKMEVIRPIEDLPLSIPTTSPEVQIKSSAAAPPLSSGPIKSHHQSHEATITNNMSASSLAKTDMTAKVTVSLDKDEPAQGAMNSDVSWVDLIDHLSLAGMAKTVIMHCNLIEKTSERIILGLESNYQAMLTSTARASIEKALQAYWQEALKVVFEVVSDNANASNTPAAQKQRANEADLALAKTGLSTDSCFNEIIEQFDGKVDDSSVQLINQK